MPETECVDRVEVLARLRLPPLIRGDDEHDGRRRPEAREHVADEATVAGHVDECELLARRQVEPREPEIDRQATLLLRLEPIRVGARESPHEGALAVVDVTGRRDDAHQHSLPASRTAPPLRSAT